MTDKTKKIVKWSGVGAVAVGTIAIIASGAGPELALRVVDIVTNIINSLGRPL